VNGAERGFVRVDETDPGKWATRQSPTLEGGNILPKWSDKTPLTSQPRRVESYRVGGFVKKNKNESR